MNAAPWKIITNDAVKSDLRALDKSQRKEVLRAMKKVSMNPLPASEGGYGNPLGNKSGLNLTGCLKIKLLRLGIRIVYRLRRTERGMQIIVISVRADNEVYRIADERLKKEE
ncbi:MAG: type II toxin-antitoxin system RelE/ParE family toxin [Schwartzia sp.]|nr:type II toxin-antitoxin system RelE/ParE family toxin [Schwartzia sp. (in: firmicutes)]